MFARIPSTYFIAVVVRESLTVRRGRWWWCERRVDLRMIVPGGDGERVAVVRHSGRGRGRSCGPVVVIVPGRGVSVQRAGVVVREERVHVVGHVVGHQRLVAARRRRTRRRVVPPVMRRVMVMVVMSPGTADHFHAGSHFHTDSRDARLCQLQNNNGKSVFLQTISNAINCIISKIAQGAIIIDTNIFIALKRIIHSIKLLSGKPIFLTIEIPLSMR